MFRPTICRFADSQESRLQVSKCSNMCSAALEGGRSAHIHELYFHATNCSDMDCIELQGGILADSQEWHFHAAKLSD